MPRPEFASDVAAFAASRVEQWNGNQEAPLRTLFTDPDHILRWAWRVHPRTETRVREALATPDGPVVVRLCGRRDVHAWLAGPVAAVAGV